ncbi:hypothetical protein BCR32DRAFT_295499 [Anaeromyces robustus]|uniref:Uncharacterized protein n=1 Tax=Anaeromyces robustus TaxID=1754192 RepID=A0A1Y1WVP3_9FUNG|nr:hypothetical protein BCR32DRAFT_295499 [Anaeromyces robustus]|eukprot:ORX77631.1 hypothetical protein BCR32DRAFT_295499 [Anaeromyces robustus]
MSEQQEKELTYEDTHVKLKYIDSIFEETEKNKQLEYIFLERVNTFNSLVNEDDKFKEYKTYLKNKELSVKILDKNEIEDRRKEFVADVLLILFAHYPKLEKYTNRNYNDNLKKEDFENPDKMKENINILREKTIYTSFFEKFVPKLLSISESILTISKDYENHKELKNDIFSEENCILNSPRLIEGYAELLNVVTKKLKENNSSSSDNNIKLVYLLEDILADISRIKITREYVNSDYYPMDSERIENTSNDELFTDKYLNLITKHENITNIKKTNLKIILNQITINYLLF